MTKIADDVDFDLQAFIGQRAFFQAAPGGGKSTGARLLLEAAYGTFQELILDVDGDFHTIRTEGRDYAIIGGDNGDAPLSSVAAAGNLALTLLRVGVSAVIQIDDLTRDDQRGFVGQFVAGLMQAPRELWHPVILMLDEAHYFTPESSVVASSEPVTHYATGGRKRGFSAIFATTRISLFSKDVLGTCSNKFLGRVEQAADRAAAADQLGFTAKSAEAVEMQAFAAGEFYCVGPALTRTPVRTQLYMPKTEVPRAGVPVLPSPTPAAIRQALAQLVAAGTKKDPENIPQNIPASPDEIAAAEKRGYDRGYDEGIANGYPDGHTDGYADGIRDTEQRLGALVLAFAGDFALAANTLAPKPKTEIVGDSVLVAGKEVAKVTGISVGTSPDTGEPAIDITHLARSETTIRGIRDGQDPPQTKAPKPATVPGLTGPQTKVLQSLAWWASVGITTPLMAQVAIIAGWSPNSSNIRDRVTELARSEHIARPVPGTVQLTDIGRQVAPPPARVAFREAIQGVLTNPQNAVLTAMVPLTEPISVRDLAGLVGWSPDSSNIRDRLTELSVLRIVERPAKGFVQITAWVRDGLSKRVRGAR